MHYKLSKRSSLPDILSKFSAQFESKPVKIESKLPILQRTPKKSTRLGMAARDSIFMTNVGQTSVGQRNCFEFKCNGLKDLIDELEQNKQQVDKQTGELAKLLSSVRETKKLFLNDKKKSSKVKRLFK